MTSAISTNLRALWDQNDRGREFRNNSRPGTPGEANSPLSAVDPSELPPPRRIRKNTGSQPNSRSASLAAAHTPYTSPPVDNMTFSLPDGHDKFDPEDSTVGRRSRNPYIVHSPEFRSRTPSPISFARDWDDEEPVRTIDMSIQENRRSGSQDSATRPTVHRSSSAGPDAPAGSSKPLHLRYLSRMEQVLGRKRASVSIPSSSTHTRNRSNSSRSEFSELTQEPLSSPSPEPHISISSSRYSGSIQSLSLNPVHDEELSIDISRTLSDDEDTTSLKSEVNSVRSSPLRATATPPRTASPGSASFKPPVPTTPKPSFNRPLPTKNPRSLPRIPTNGNNLTVQERAELIRKNRKLTQMFGQTPHAQAIAPDSPSSSSDARRGFHRPAMSIADRAIWPPPADTIRISANPRRHSTPLTPQELSFFAGSSETLDRDSVASRQSHHRDSAGSPDSFIDLSDEESGGDTPMQVHDRRHKLPFSTMEQDSSLESLSLEEQADEERRRKRDKLAKLHRFLGSRVPPELALGFNFADELPPVAVTFGDEEEEERSRFGLLRRRSPIEAEYVVTEVSQADRLKSDLDLEEKALNVRRAAKMEQVFGIAPPQTLYHTRHISALPESSGAELAQPFSAPLDVTTPVAYNFKIDHRGKKTTRPGTAESSQQLIPKDSYGHEFYEEQTVEVYKSYRESLNSLNEIIDRGDRASLEVLHEIIHGELEESATPLQAFTRLDEASSSSRAERRRSLPSQPSITSLSSLASSISPPEISAFEQKRRRANKLTNFFGVNHRDIMAEILENIEKGVEEDRGNGNLDPEQVKELLQNLRKLRNKT